MYCVPLYCTFLVLLSSYSPVSKLRAHQTGQQQGEKHASNVSRLPFRKHSKQLSNYFNYSRSTPRQELGQTVADAVPPPPPPLPLQIRTVTQLCKISPGYVSPRALFTSSGVLFTPPVYTIGLTVNPRELI